MNAASPDDSRFDDQRPAADAPAGMPSDRVADSAAESSAGAERFRQAFQGRSPGGATEDGELWSGGYSSKAMIGHWLTAGLVTVATLIGVILWNFASGPLWLAWLVLGVLIWGGLGCCYFYRRWTRRYALTNKRFLHESGLLRRTTDRIEVIDIDDVSFVQGPIERMVGVGSIKITSSDRSHPELVLSGIDDVRRVADLIDNTRRAERERRGVFVESV
jgi:membrane protein YdbS with pleckstrin-like domain